MRRLSMWVAILTILTVAFGAITVGAEDYVDLVRRGNQAYRSSDFDKALEYYHSAETELPESPELEYNMGAALHEQKSYEEALERYTRALNTQDIQQEARAHYNLGNTHFRIGDYQKAIESYQNTLEINPDDVDAKYNLELARRKLKEQMKSEQQQQQQNQQQQQEQQDQQKQDEQQGQQPPEEQEQQQQEPQDGDDQEQQQQQQAQPGEDEEEQQEEAQPQPDQEEISKEEARRILNALRDDEEEIQKQIKRRKVQSSGYSGKDW